MSAITFVASVAILLVASVIIFPSNGVTEDILAAICSQTQNQETCEAILESDPRTSSADLPLLSLISLELLSKQADKNHNSFVIILQIRIWKSPLAIVGHIIMICGARSRCLTSCPRRDGTKEFLN